MASTSNSEPPPPASPPPPPPDNGIQVPLSFDHKGRLIIWAPYALTPALCASMQYPNPQLLARATGSQKDARDFATQVPEGAT